MSQQPVIFLAFANSEDAHLSMLKRESKNINRALEALDDKQLVKIAREESVGVDEIFHNFNRFKDRIAIFHYGGHADGASLHLEDAAANADGLAQLIAAEPNLKLVFLNGCSTKAQVDKLMELGIKAVIGTAVEINDTKATEFAEHFYSALANKSTIKKAFDFAVSFLKTKYGEIETPEITSFRGLKLKREGQKEVFPWGLYLNENADDILEWTLPTQFTSTVTRPASEDEYLVNDYIYPLLEDMAEHEPSIKDEMYDKDGELIDDRELLAKIIENFPWPIGAQIRRLVSNDADMNKPSLPRLKQIISTYIVTSQLLFYILLSQMWEEKKKSKEGLEPKAYLMDALGLNGSNFHYFDYFAHIKQIIADFNESNIKLFVPDFTEIEAIIKEKKDTYNAYIFLESLRSRLAENQDLSAEINQLCADAEYALSLILSAATFLVKYQMLTVRDIILANPRHKDAEFKHFMGRLNAFDDDFLSLFKKPRYFSTYTDNRSVILVKDLKDVSSFLNLSPFIIDKNAFGDAKATATDVFMYAYQEDGEYQYIVSRQNIYKALEQDADRINTGMEEKNEVASRSRSRRFRGRSTSEPKRPYAVLKEQFELFKNDLTL